MKCPKCGYERQRVEDAPAWQCPSCKIAYAKVGAPAEVPSAAARAAAAAATAARVEDIDAHEKLSLAASGQKIAIYCILLNVGLQGVSRNQALPALVLLALSCLVGIFALIGVVRICSGLGKSQNAKIRFMVAAFVPLMNVITLVYLSVKTTRELRRAGWRVGLLGARP
jgi:hypothetical protein